MRLRPCDIGIRPGEPDSSVRESLDIGSLFVNPPETAPKNEYVTLHGFQGERVTGMLMADGRWLVRDGERVGAMSGDGIAGWSERE